MTLIRDTAAQDVAINHTPHRRYLIWSGGALFVLIIVFYIFQNWLNNINTDATAARASLQIATVSMGDVQRDISVQGQVVAANSPTLYSTAQGIITYYVKAGDTVQKDQLLADVDSPETTAELKQQQANLARLQGQREEQKITAQRELLDRQQQRDLAEVDLTSAQREEKRSQHAWDKKVISERDYLRSLDELARAKVRYQQTLTALQLAKQSIGYEDTTLGQQVKAQQLLVTELQRRADTLHIKSPVSGMVGSLAQVQKAAVPAYQPLLTVVDLTAYEVEVMVPESYADELSVKQPVEINFNGQQWPGEIAAISPEITNNQVVARIRFSGQPPQQIRQNQRLSGRIMLENQQQVVRVENGSFINADHGRSVFVIQGDKAQRRPITLGAQGYRYVEIKKGLQPGEQIIISDTSRFKDAKTLLLTP